MKLSTPSKTLGNLARPRKVVATTPVTTFSKLAVEVQMPETTLRKRLTRLGIPIPSKGFDSATASDINQLIHAQGCMQGWNLVAEFSNRQAQVREAGKQAASFRARFEKLLTKLASK